MRAFTGSEKLTWETVDEGGLFGAGLVFRQGTALGTGVLEEMNSSREQGLVRAQDETGSADEDLRVTHPPPAPALLLCPGGPVSGLAPPLFRCTLSFPPQLAFSVIFF